MNKYMFLFRGGMSPADTAPEQMQAQMMKWKNWMDALAAKGKLLGGEPLEGGGKVVNGRAKKITDGPFAESKEIVGGYLVVDAASLDEATELSKDCPVFEADGSVEVRAVMAMNM